MSVKLQISDDKYSQSREQRENLFSLCRDQDVIYVLQDKYSQKPRAESSLLELCRLFYINHISAAWTGDLHEKKSWLSRAVLFQIDIYHTYVAGFIFNGKPVPVNLEMFLFA